MPDNRASKPVKMSPVAMLPKPNDLANRSIKLKPPIRIKGMVMIIVTVLCTRLKRVVTLVYFWDFLYFSLSNTSENSVGRTGDNERRLSRETAVSRI